MTHFIKILKLDWIMAVIDQDIGQMSGRVDDEWPKDLKQTMIMTEIVRS